MKQNNFILPIVVLIICGFNLLMITSCGSKEEIPPPEPLTADSIFNKYSKSVVRIKHSFVYKMDLGADIGTQYFTEFSEEEGIGAMYEKIEDIENPITVYGTGFFVSQNGKIATNRHVIDSKDEELFKKILTSMKMNMMQLDLAIDVMEGETRQKAYDIEDAINTLNEISCYGDSDCEDAKEEKMEELQYAAVEVVEEMEEMETIKLMSKWFKEFGVDDAKIDVETVSLGIAIHDTWVNDDEDFIRCVPLRTSNDKDIDLAIIQTNSRSLPDGVDSLIMVNTQTTKDTTIKTINSTLYMIGYNGNLEQTNSGIKAQLTEGKITRVSDGIDVMHSIDALPGSSGSPIINEWGKLVGINYKGLNGEDFNFGIVAKHLYYLMEKTN